MSATTMAARPAAVHGTTHVRSTDVYAIAAAALATAPMVVGVEQAVTVLHTLTARRQPDAAYLAAARIVLSTARTALVMQTAPDFWVDTFLSPDGELRADQMDQIADLVAERRSQVQHLDAALGNLHA